MSTKENVFFKLLISNLNAEKKMIYRLNNNEMYMDDISTNKREYISPYTSNKISFIENLIKDIIKENLNYFLFPSNECFAVMLIILNDKNHGATIHFTGEDVWNWARNFKKM